MPLAWMLLAASLAGCQTTGLTPNNYLSEIEIKKYDYQIYSAEYAGTEKGCFPPVTGRDCSNSGNLAVYSPKVELFVEAFSLTHRAQFPNPEKQEEFLFLTAADLALQRGFSKFTVYSIADYSGCASSPKATSTGTIRTNKHTGSATYSGTTSIRRYGSCLTSKTLNVFMLNDKRALRDGVFIRTEFGGKNLKPFESLYYGTMDGLDFDKHVHVVSQEGPGTTSLYTRMTTGKAWENVYDAPGLSADLRNKYGVKKKKNIIFEDEVKTKKIQRENDLIRKNMDKTN